MSKATVNKQIAHANACANRCEKYSKGLKTIVSMCKLIAPFGQYNRLPDEFKIDQKKSIQVIMQDLRSMIDEADHMALKKRLYAEELSNERIKQLETTSNV